MSYYDDNIEEKIDSALAMGKMVLVKQAQDHPPLHFDLMGARNTKGSALAMVHVEGNLYHLCYHPNVDLLFSRRPCSR